jgi:hypothetical protein
MQKIGFVILISFLVCAYSFGQGNVEEFRKSLLGAPRYRRFDLLILMEKHGSPGY